MSINTLDECKLSNEPTGKVLTIKSGTWTFKGHGKTINEAIENCFSAMVNKPAFLLTFIPDPTNEEEE